MTPAARFAGITLLAVLLGGAGRAGFAAKSGAQQ